MNLLLYITKETLRVIEVKDTETEKRSGLLGRNQFNHMVPQERKKGAEEWVREI